MKAWCHKCRKHQDLDNPKDVLHNSRQAAKGTCKKCKTEIITYITEQSE